MDNNFTIVEKFKFSLGIISVLEMFSLLQACNDVSVGLIEVVVTPHIAKVWIFFFQFFQSFEVFPAFAK